MSSSFKLSALVSQVRDKYSPSYPASSTGGSWWHILQMHSFIRLFLERRWLICISISAPILGRLGLKARDHPENMLVLVAGLQDMDPYGLYQYGSLVHRKRKDIRSVAPKTSFFPVRKHMQCPIRVYLRCRDTFVHLLVSPAR
jgi:hypothetical protein